MASLLNKTHVKAFTLACAKARQHPFRRVSEEFMDRANGQLRQWIAEEVKRLPSVGVTIK